MSDAADVLRKTALFAAVPEKVMDELTRLMIRVQVSAGTVLFHEGDPGDALYLVIDGTLNVEKDGVLIVTRSQGELVGEMALLDDTSRSSDVIAASDATLLKLERDDFMRLYAESRDLATGFFRMLTGKLREGTSRQVENVKERTLAFEGQQQTSTFLLRLSPGDLFAGRYLIERKCGEGGMGTVFKATDTILRTAVALKILTNLNSENLLERFKREVIIARKVIHPNACRIHDIAENGGIHYVSMEYLEGETLARVLVQKKRFKVEEALPIFLQTLSALAEIHRTGIVHRDLKPQNIMITPSGRAIIMDFGIAFSAEEDLRLTHTGILLGTPHYMSPEQIRGEPVDQRADIYSFGIIMFEMLTGKEPFSGGSALAILSAQLNTAIPKPTSLNPEIPAALEDIVLRTLSKDREQRITTADELIQALQSL